jgi:hypothetical protein
MNIRPVGPELLHADRRTEMTKLIVAFAIFANAPKILYSRAAHRWQYAACPYMLYT